MSGTSRRDFMKQAAVSTATLSTAWWVGGESRLFAKEKSPVERLNFAAIGVGGKGGSDTAEAARLGNLVAICDVDDNTLAAAARRYPKAKKFNDYRKMLEEFGKEIDAVTVSTPDHTHAPASVLAMRNGKHCFCQKPLTWSVEEARLMRELAAEKKVATQMGNQGTALNSARETVEIIRAGGIGDVKEVHVWTNRPIWPQGTGRPKETPAVPKHLHWDLFLGAAQERPYHPTYHPFRWRGWLDFGTGALGDMACHTANVAVMALDLFDPKTVEAISSGIVENETFPKFSQIDFEFGARGKLPPVKMVWYDGGKLPPAELLHGQKLTASGFLLVGSKGTLFSPSDYGERFVLLPQDKFEDFKKPAPTLPRSPGHFEEFVAACKGGPKAMSNFDYAGRLTETILLGNVAMRVGKKIEWDAKTMKCTNAPEADAYIRRDYRKGFGIT